MAWMPLLGQSDAAANVTNTALVEAAKFGPTMFILVFVFLGLFAFGAAHFYFVHIPNVNASRKNQELLTTAIAAITPVVADTKDIIDRVGGDVTEIKERIHMIVRAMRAKVQVLKTLAKEAGINISEEIGEMVGILRDEDND